MRSLPLRDVCVLRLSLTVNNREKIKNTRHSSPTPLKTLTHRKYMGDELMMSRQPLIILQHAYNHTFKAGR